MKKQIKTVATAIGLGASIASGQLHARETKLGIDTTKNDYCHYKKRSLNNSRV